MRCSNVWISRDGQRIEVTLGASGDVAAATVGHSVRATGAG